MIRKPNARKIRLKIVTIARRLEVLTETGILTLGSPGVCDNEAFWIVQPFPANPAGIQMAVRALLLDLKAN